MTNVWFRSMIIFPSHKDALSPKNVDTLEKYSIKTFRRVSLHEMAFCHHLYNVNNKLLLYLQVYKTNNGMNTTNDDLLLETKILFQKTKLIFVQKVDLRNTNLNAFVFI